MEDIHTLLAIIEQNALVYKYLKDCPYHILRAWEVLSFSKGDELIHQGEICGHFFILESGIVDVNIISEEGKRYSHAIYQEGNYLGELEIFDQMEYCCNVLALTDGRALRIARADFLQWMETDRNIQRVLLQDVCSKFYALSTKAAADAFYGLKYRLCEFLLQCLERHHYIDQRRRLLIHKTELGSYLGVTRRSINRVLLELREKGIVEMQDGYLSVCDVDLLKKEVAGSKRIRK